MLHPGFPEFEKGGPVATRYSGGRPVTIPGARGPGQPGYSPLIDGCTSIGDDPLCATSNNGAGARTLVVRRRVSASRTSSPGPPTTSWSCSRRSAPRAARIPAANQRSVHLRVRARHLRDRRHAPSRHSRGRQRELRPPRLHLGRGSEIQLRYLKDNVLGFATDFANDTTGTNWSIEATWIKGSPSRSRARSAAGAAATPTT